MTRDRYQPNIDRSTALEIFGRQESLPPSSHIVLLTYRGSISHGTFDPDGIDDVDTLGLYIEDWSHYLGFPKSKSQLSVDAHQSRHDLAAHEFRKGVDLLIDANPNVWPLLFCPDEQVIMRNNIGDRLRDNRDLFLTKQVYHTFRGIARSNIQRMKKSREEGLPYAGWMGKQRKELADEVGYDPKAASHAIRYLVMCLEMLRDGNVFIDRTSVGDQNRYRQIKEGGWEFNEVLSITDELEEMIEEAKENTNLPERPDRDRIEQLMIECLEQFFGVERWGQKL